MESAYTLAGRELARRREENRKEHDRRRKKVLAAAPAMAELEQKLALGGTALIKCVMDRPTFRRLRQESGSCSKKSGSCSARCICRTIIWTISIPVRTVTIPALTRTAGGAAAICS